MSIEAGGSRPWVAFNRVARGFAPVTDGYEAAAGSLGFALWPNPR